MTHQTQTREPAAGTLSRLPARVFYGVILAGVLLGSLACGGGASLYLLDGGREATGQAIRGDVARELVMAVAIMTGATFGGILGFAVAAMWDRCWAKPR